MKRLLTFLMPLFGLAVFAVVLQRTGPERILAVLAEVDVRRLAYAPFLLAAVMVARGARWRYVMRCVGIDISLAQSTLIYVIGFFASSITPAKAGDAVRAIYLRNHSGRPTGEAFLTVFVDRLWDLGFILVAGSISIIAFSRRYIEIPSAPLFVAAALLIALAAIVVTRRSLVRTLLKPAFSLLVPVRFRGGLSANFHSFYDALRDYGRDPRRALTMCALTLGCWVLIFLLAVYVLWLVDMPVSAHYLVLVMPIVTLVELIPFSVAGLGTRDATVVYFFGVVGAGSAEAVAFSILYVLIATYATSLVGFIFWLRHPVRWRASESP